MLLKILVGKSQRLCRLSAVICWGSFLIQLEIFWVLGTMHDFVLYPGHFGITS